MYQQNDLQIVTPPCAEALKNFEEIESYVCNCGEAHEIRDSSDDYNPLMEGNVYLPHSCDEWVIGNHENIKDLIDDLQAALVKIEK